MMNIPITCDMDLYAGRWVALVRDHIVGVGLTAHQARAAAQHMRPKETPEIIYVPESVSDARLQISDRPLVQTVLHILTQRGIEGLLVGGAVRDMLLNRPVHDWDFVVEREAIPVARAVAHELGAAYYTLDAERETGRVVLRHPNGARTFLDFALRRGATWVADLEARDFTSNAIALSVYPPGRLFDPTGGRADLEARQIRAASETSFQDDPVRILRSVRMAALLGFEIETQTALWAQCAVPHLEHISAERIRDELTRLLAMDHTLPYLRCLDEWGALERILPEIIVMKDTDQSRPHHWNVFEHTLMLVGMLERMLAGLKDEADKPMPTLPVALHVWDDLKHTLGPYRQDLLAHLAQPLSDERTVLESLKLAALLHDCGKPATLTIGEDGRTHFYQHDRLGADMAAARLRALRLARVEVERVQTIIAHHMRPQQLADAGLTSRGLYRYFRDTGEAGVEIVLLALADHLATHGPDLPMERWRKRLEVAAALIGGYFERVREQLTTPALISGGELVQALGLPPGPRIGKLLETIREAQAAGEIHTKQEAMELARRTLNVER